MEYSSLESKLLQELQHQKHIPISTRAREFDADNRPETSGLDSTENLNDVGKKHGKLLNQAGDVRPELGMSNPVELIPF